MPRPKKITQNINKDAGLLDMPRVKVPHSQWEMKHSNYLTCNIGEIVPIYCEEVIDSEKKRITMGQLSHMTTPIAPIFNAQYTEFRAFFVPYRLCADLMAGYKTRKSPWVKVFGEDNASANADIVVPLANQKLPTISSNLASNFTARLNAFGGIADALDYGTATDDLFSEYNFLDLAAYELIYQHCYRNQNRESATSSNLYKWLFDIYNRTSVSGINYYDDFHIANREKDYFTGSQPFTQKSNSPVTVGLTGLAPVSATTDSHLTNSVAIHNSTVPSVTGSNNFVNPVIFAQGGQSLPTGVSAGDVGFMNSGGGVTSNNAAFDPNNLWADLTKAAGVDINQLRIMIKTQELLEKDMMYGSDYMSSLNAHFGTAPISLVLDEPLELKKVSITSQMQPIFQQSSTSGESTILGTIGANATTQSGEFEILPLTEFKEHGVLMICAVHKAQNAYDTFYYKPKRIFKKSRFDYFTPELNDLGYQPVQRKEFNGAYDSSHLDTAVSYNEAWAEYRFNFNKIHGMFQASRTGALSYWTLGISNYADVQSLYKQSKTELDRAISVSSTNAPQFFDAYGFVEYVSKPMSLHSIPGMDGVI